MYDLVIKGLNVKEIAEIRKVDVSAVYDVFKNIRKRGYELKKPAFYLEKSNI